jgi:hypothetical protein
VAAPDRTIRFTSSYSGTGRTDPSGSVASFTRTRPYRVSSVRAARSSFIRSHAWNRRPIAVETENTAEETISSRSSGHRRRSTQPGRFFFIVAGRIATSRAPAASARSIRSSNRCGLMSSMFASTSRTRSRPRAPGTGSPATTRSRFGRPGISRCPSPIPTPRTVIPGGRPKETSNARSSAAPVGVTSSPSPSPNRHGASRSSSSVAGPGTGIFPCSDQASPDPPGRGEQNAFGAPRCSNRKQPDTMSTIASTAPTSWKWTLSTVVP